MKASTMPTKIEIETPVEWWYYNDERGDFAQTFSFGFADGAVFEVSYDGG